MRAERGGDNDEALVASVSATIRDVAAELTSRPTGDRGLLRRLQAMVDDVFSHWDGLARKAEAARGEAEDAMETARLAVEDAEVRLNEYVAACEAQRESDLSRVEADCAERIDAVHAEADAARASAERGMAVLAADRETLLHALGAMSDAMQAATEADADEVARGEHAVVAARDAQIGAGAPA